MYFQFIQNVRFFRIEIKYLWIVGKISIKPKVYDQYTGRKGDFQ